MTTNAPKFAGVSRKCVQRVVNQYYGPKVTIEDILPQFYADKALGKATDIDLSSTLPMPEPLRLTDQQLLWCGRGLTDAMAYWVQLAIDSGEDCVWLSGVRSCAYSSTRQTVAWSNYISLARDRLGRVASVYLH